MTCFIYSEFDDTGNNLIKNFRDNLGNINLYDNKNDLKYMSVDDFWGHTIISVSNGFFVNICDEVFVISTCHSICSNRATIFSFYMDDGIVKKIKLSVKKIIEEFDLAILSIDNNGDNGDNVDNPIISYDIATLKNCFVNMSHTLYSKSFELVNNNATDIIEKINKYDNCTICDNDFIFKILKGYEIPMIKMRCDSSDDSGKSGSIVYSDTNNIVGLIMEESYDKSNNKYIYALPLHIVAYIIEAYSTEQCVDIKSVIMNTQICEIEDDTIDGTIDGTIDETIDDTIDGTAKEIAKEKNMIKYGHYVIDTFDIKYNDIYGKNFKFNIGDVLIEINDIIFESDGRLHGYCIDMKFKTYLLLYFLKNKYVKIKYYRDNNLCEILLCCKKMATNIRLNFIQNRNFIFYNGLIFMELSENMLIEFKKNGIDCQLDGISIIEPENKKLIVLIHIDYKYLTTKYKHNKNNKNIKEFENWHISNKNICILKQIGKNNITDLRDTMCKLQSCVKNNNNNNNNVDILLTFHDIKGDKKIKF